MPSARGTQGKHGKYHYRLYCPSGEDGVAFLSVRLRNGKRVDLELKPHKAKLIHVLHRAHLKDTGVSAAGAHGWRPRTEIAKDIEARTGYAVGEGTVSAYAVKLLRKLAMAVKAVSPGENVPLIERRRKLGFRLAENVEIEILDGTRHGRGDDA